MFRIKAWYLFFKSPSVPNRSVCCIEWKMVRSSRCCAVFGHFLYCFTSFDSRDFKFSATSDRKGPGCVAEFCAIRSPEFPTPCPNKVITFNYWFNFWQFLFHRFTSIIIQKFQNWVNMILGYSANLCQVAKERAIEVAQQGYARSRSARQWPQSKVNILVLFAIFLIKATET